MRRARVVGNRHHGAVARERAELRHRFDARVAAHGFIAIDDGVRMLAHDERRVSGVIERELLRWLVFPNEARGAHPGRYSDPALLGQRIDDDFVFRFARYFDRNDLVGEVARGVRGAGAPVTLVRKAILLANEQLTDRE